MRITKAFVAAVACIVASLGALAKPAQVEGQPVKLAGLNAVVWISPEAPPGKLPVIVFSHGFHGCATQSKFLMRAFAQAGYFVVAPNHHDATCEGGSASWFAKSVIPFQDAAQWDDTSYRDRRDDIAHLIDALPADERFRDRVDMTRLGLAGHSLGGYTVLGLAGAWPSWKLKGVKAVLALSPYTQPYGVHDTLGGLAAPVMYQGGTLDFGITPELHKSMGSYDRSPAPKYYVEFEGAGHFAWTDLRSTFHESVDAYSVAFMDRYVKGAPAAAVLGQSLPDVAILRSDVGAGAGH
jgi:predicted dienelactone hydrolase